MKPYNCPNCGGAFPTDKLNTEFVTCEFCGTTFRVPKTLTPEPDMGDLLLGADFSRKPIPGWELLNEDKLTLHSDGDSSELRGAFSAHTRTYYLLKGSGLIDNFDASVSMKFLDGNIEWIRTGFYTRFSDEGGYGFLVSAQGSYTFGLFVKDKNGELIWQKLMAWTYHTALHSGLHLENRLRVICNQDRFRVYLNGVLAASFKDTRFEVGKLYLAVEPSEKSNVGIAFSNLELREVLE